VLSTSDRDKQQDALMKLVRKIMLGKRH